MVVYLLLSTVNLMAWFSAVWVGNVVFILVSVYKVMVAGFFLIIRVVFVGWLVLNFVFFNIKVLFFIKDILEKMRYIYDFIMR